MFYKIKKVLILLFLFVIMVAPIDASFAQLTEVKCVSSATNICLNVPVGKTKSVLDLGSYIQLWYNFVIGGVGIMATVIIMWGGFKWLTSHGNSAMIGDAKDRIFAAITGLVIAFLSFTILALINGTGSGSFLDIGLPNELMTTVSVTVVQNAFNNETVVGDLRGDAVRDFWERRFEPMEQSSSGQGEQGQNEQNMPPGISEDGFAEYWVQDNQDLLNRMETPADRNAAEQEARDAYQDVLDNYPVGDIYNYRTPEGRIIVNPEQDIINIMMEATIDDPGYNYYMEARQIAGRTEYFIIRNPQVGN